MIDAKFDNLARFFGSRPSRRLVLKGLVTGGALTAAAITLPISKVGAQCLEDGEACSSGSECCTGNCDATTGYCGLEGETVCVPDGEACSSAKDCCTGNCDATTGYCGLPVESSGGTTGTTGTGGATTLPASGSGTSQGADMSMIVPVAAVGAAAAVLGGRRMRATAQDDAQA